MANFSTISPHIHSENIAASAIMAVVGVFGLVSNSAAILAVRYNPALRNSFGLLCFSHITANMGGLLVSVFWAAPITLLGSEISTKMIGKMFGTLSSVLWIVCVYSHLAISLNRVIAVRFPIQVRSLLSVKNTSFVVLICWMLSCFYKIPHFLTRCYIFFEPAKWAWTYTDSRCRSFIFIKIKSYITSAVIILIIVLDCITLISLRIKDKVNKSHIYTNVAQRKRKEMEVRLVKQAYRSTIPLSSLLSRYQMVLHKDGDHQDRSYVDRHISDSSVSQCETCELDI